MSTTTTRDRRIAQLEALLERVRSRVKLSMTEPTNTTPESVQVPTEEPIPESRPRLRESVVDGGAVAEAGALEIEDDDQPVDASPESGPHLALAASPVAAVSGHRELAGPSRVEEGAPVAPSADASRATLVDPLELAPEPPDRSDTARTAVPRPLVSEPPLAAADTSRVIKTPDRAEPRQLSFAPRTDDDELSWRPAAPAGGEAGAHGVRKTLEILASEGPVAAAPAPNVEEEPDVVIQIEEPEPIAIEEVLAIASEHPPAAFSDIVPVPQEKPPAVPIEMLAAGLPVEPPDPVTIPPRAVPPRPAIEPPAIPPAVEAAQPFPVAPTHGKPSPSVQALQLLFEGPDGSRTPIELSVETYHAPAPAAETVATFVELARTFAPKTFGDLLEATIALGSDDR